MEKLHKIGLGAILLGVAGAVALGRAQPEAQPTEVSRPDQARLQLASVSVAARQNVDYAALDARLRRLIEERAMVGLAVGVVENGRITFLNGYGETLAGTGEKVTSETVFRWASVSKGVAATMVATLAEDGKVDLGAPIVNYASSLKLPAGAEYRATVGDMLSHRLGLYRNAYDNKLEEGQNSRFLRQTLAQLNLICPPGTCWSYQNIAYDGASELVEGVAGASYENALRQRLFNPIGMTSASVSMAGLLNAKSWARPHDAARRPVALNDNYYRVPAAGGVNSNIKDLALWMVAQMGQMPDVLSPKLLRTIHAPIVKTPGENRRMRKFLERIQNPHYGYGWRSYDFAGHRIVGHHGGVSGYRALIMFDPAKKSGVVALWNSNTSQPTALEIEVMDMVFGLPFRDWLQLDTAPAAPAPANPAEAEDEDGSNAAAAVASSDSATAPSG
ncbi:MAG: beta-lactamase family protein [Pseudomonadota bacterium]|nr:beta-lactamase family protein [Pseudomonadota bacterium]